jgi:hypothetical protein
MAFRNFWFRSAYAGPVTITGRIIMPTGIAGIRLEVRIVAAVDIELTGFRIA